MFQVNIPEDVYDYKILGNHMRSLGHDQLK